MKFVNFAIVFVLCFITIIQANLFGRKQRYMAKGKLVCGNQPAANVLVKLLDEDDGGFDDKMDEKRTDSHGFFAVDGTESELSPIDPKLIIYHDCNDPEPCERKWQLKLPNKHINTNKPMDLGTLNLEAMFLKEKRECLT